ncbi:amidase signature enzyme [Cyathus striatus]|nr:amidase signature enzyme [Cyathus striatus]
MFEYFAHRRAVKAKRAERAQRLATLPPDFHSSLTQADYRILAQPVSYIVSQVQDGSIDPQDVLLAYGKQAIRAHRATNCLTEVMITDAIEWAGMCDKNGPLAGMPVSMKDTVGVAGYDSTMGYTPLVNRPFQRHAPLTQLLLDAGALPFVKTNIPITLLSFESTNPLFGRTSNPHNAAYSPGGSTGGESALLAYGGSRIGIGTDVAGSVRVPAHYSGVYSIKCSTGRFMKVGNATSIPGQEGVPAVYSPMARTLEDLETFWKGVMSMSPWKYDHTVHPIPWREVEFKNPGKPKWGVIRHDGFVTPSPACERALDTVIEALKAQGHEVIELTPPSIPNLIQIGAQLLLADGLRTCTDPISYFESNDPGVAQGLKMFQLPSILRKLYTWYIRYVKHDNIYASLLDGYSEKSVYEFWKLVALREGEKQKWKEYLDSTGVELTLTVPNALPAVPDGGMKYGWRACGYSFMFNILDYTAGVLPVTKVSSALDGLGKGFRSSNAVEGKVYEMYDAKGMHGLPVGVQVAGRRLEEELVLKGMWIVKGALEAKGKGYDLLI